MVSKVASFVGKIFVVRPPTTKTTNILPHENSPLYGTSFNPLPFGVMSLIFLLDTGGILAHAQAVDTRPTSLSEVWPGIEANY